MIFDWNGKKRWRLFAAGVVAGGLLVGLGYVGWLVFIIVEFATTPWCGYDVRQQALSPDGINKAAVVEVNCGATTGYVSWAVRAPASRAFNYRRDVLASVDGREMKIAWAGPKLVVFVPPARVRELSAKAAAEVEYRPLTEGSR
jgi:hypothetical protein